MRLLASNRVRGEFGRTREMSLLRRRQFPQLFLIGDARLRRMVQQRCWVSAVQ